MTRNLQNRGKHLRKGVRILSFYDAFKPNLKHENRRSFLFSRLDVLTEPILARCLETLNTWCNFRHLHWNCSTTSAIRFRIQQEWSAHTDVWVCTGCQSLQWPNDVSIYLMYHDNRSIIPSTATTPKFWEGFKIRVKIHIQILRYGYFFFYPSTTTHEPPSIIS